MNECCWTYLGLWIVGDLDRPCRCGHDFADHACGGECVAGDCRCEEFEAKTEGG